MVQTGFYCKIGLVFLLICINLSMGCSKPSRVQYYGYYPKTVVTPESSPPLTSSRPQVIEKTLWIPQGSKTLVHEVAPLETLWRISKMYGVSAETIRRANNLRSDRLEIGQRLIIPNAAYFKNIIPLYPSTKWRYIIIHHTATEIGKAFTIHESHQMRGFINGLGYHFLIDNGTLGKGDGQIEVSPRWIKQEDGAHCKAGGMNTVGIGVALVGNFNEKSPTQSQLNSLIALLKALMEYYRIPITNVMGHREVQGANTDCPGNLFPWTTVKVALRSS
ncbi:MAG: N-acetylmuramoyl-L-alanine amidase [Syntrophobacterales bacterium]|nr:N-acetylmuramoyl-L-alanine amidase [Syntrophobacterales bacterium]